MNRSPRTGVGRFTAAMAFATVLLGGIFAQVPGARAQGGAVRSLPTIVSASPGVISTSDWLVVSIKGIGDDQNYVQIDPATFRLRLDGQVFNDLHPDRRGNGQYAFDLSALRQDRNWLRLLEAPPILGIKPVVVGVATAGDDLPSVSGQPVTAQIRIFSASALVVAVVGVLVVLGLILKLGITTDLLLDGRPVPNGQRRPYSLGRCQMAFWLVLVSVSFIVLTATTGDYNNIVTEQSLVLLGISGATGLSSILIDQKKAGQNWSETASAPVHTGFLRDLLTDDGGWALHRVQAFAWTLILGAVSLWSVYDRLTLPNFDTNLLALMGLSGGLYLGFKWPEMQSSAG